MLLAIMETPLLSNATPVILAVKLAMAQVRQTAFLASQESTYLRKIIAV